MIWLFCYVVVVVDANFAIVLFQKQKGDQVHNVYYTDTRDPPKKIMLKLIWNVMSWILKKIMEFYRYRMFNKQGIRKILRVFLPSVALFHTIFSASKIKNVKKEIFRNVSGETYYRVFRYLGPPLPRQTQQVYPKTKCIDWNSK